VGLPTTRRNVLGLFCEDEIEELHRRQAQINTHFGTSFADLDGSMFWTARPGLDSLLMSYDRGGEPLETPLSEEVVEFCKSNGVQLLVIDTAADVFGGREIDRLEVRQFVTLLRQLAIAGNSAVIVSSHPSLTGLSSNTGLSGSTAWHNSVRARSWLRTAATADGDKPDTNIRELVFKKSNYGPLGDPVLLRWQNGLFVPDTRVGALDKMAADNRAETVFLELLVTYEGEGRYVSATPSVTYAPKVFAEDPRSGALGKRALTDAMNRLFAAKRIKIGHHGRPSDPRTHIELVWWEG
jgi:RecA-family ATPase